MQASRPPSRCRAAASAPTWKAIRRATGARRCTTAIGCTTPAIHVPAHYGVRNDRWKLIYYYGKPLGMKGANLPDTTPDWELFDVRNDPREMHNLYHDPKYARVVGEM